jgi:hypothetical protein
MKPIELSTGRIKTTIRWFPGILLGLKRQVGKTQAVLELIHEEHEGRAVIFSPSKEFSEIAKRRYEGMYPQDTKALFACTTTHLRGFRFPVYVDEWWVLPRETRVDLMNTGLVVCRIGTETEF